MRNTDGKETDLRKLVVTEFMSLFGRKIYTKRAAFWPTVGDDDPR